MSLALILENLLLSRYSHGIFQMPLGVFVVTAERVIVDGFAARKYSAFLVEHLPEMT